MASIRLLQRKPDGAIVFREPTSDPVPAYAILSHTWGEEEVRLQDIEADEDRNKTTSKAGWAKIQFCADQAAADGLQYFWVDTCCIDKKNAVELGAAINSMFRWYQNAARCYVYLSDVSTSEGVSGGRAWEEAFRTSRWFTRGWTLQELIAPRLVDFFSVERQRLGNKLSLAAEIQEITSIPESALRGDALSNFSIKQRRSWAERRNTTIEEDEVYCLLGIFDISMALIYGERRDQALRRLEEEIHKLYKGVNLEQFAVPLNLASFPEAAEFVAREEELSKMHGLLHGHSGRAAVVLHGLGGMGKTQLAVEYVRQHKEKHTAIFWLNANDEDSLRLSFRNIAQQVLEHCPLTGILGDLDLEGDLNRVVNVVKAWLNLRGNTRWLMIYDNYDNPRIPSSSDRTTVDIRRYLPESDHGSIIITTRLARVSQGRRLHVQKLAGLEDGLKILANTSGREGTEDDPNAKALVSKLDGLPLALSTAGAYLEHVTDSFAEYLRLYEASWLELQTTSPMLSSYEDRSLYTTWQVTLDQIWKQNAASAQLLKLWAYFDKQDIWFKLLRHAHSADDEQIQKLTENKLSFNKAVRLLCEYGLAHPEPSLGQLSRCVGYGVHSCVHSWTISVLNSEWDDSLAQLALTCVASEVPSRDVDEWWLLEQRLLQHVARHERLITNGKVDTRGIEWAMHNLGDYYADQGRLAEAEAMYDRALQGREEALGAKHTSTLDTVNNLGNLYKDQGRLAEAEAMYDRALHGYEEALAPGLLPTYLPAMNNLFSFGNLYARTGREDAARQMYNRALAGYNSVQGPSSKWCKELEDRLWRLQVASAEPNNDHPGSIGVEAPKSRPLKRIFHKLRSRSGAV
ncbi:HET-domain-containing protein [Polyplosphaeria fusca]|uniref:HET-domain-containing protein n=1 Tax=Polyplosphaeria fusca TaxID=682080 RepID=A0A9P4V4S1_9PLEO|nr:HET-domain-containing protein [Polyplosphaeria fusca]